MNTEQDLPDKPSALIRLALNDLRKVEASRDYVIDMEVWHVPHETPWGEEFCHVCFAGSVMAMTLGADETEHYAPRSFREKHKLNSLDEFRRGSIHHGLRTFYQGKQDEKRVLKLPFTTPVVPYEEDKEVFHVGIENIINILKEHGF